jgi:hypothetical protein
MGWDPPSKKGELFHVDSRFILLQQFSESLTLAGGTDTGKSLVAFSMFRFDVEGGDCVLYW